MKIKPIQIAKGFTLIELLVVISIISLLMAILLPVLSKARQLAEKTVCINNLRQVGLGLFNYSTQFKSYLPPVDYQAGGGGVSGPLWTDTLYNNGYINKPTVGKSHMLVDPNWLPSRWENKWRTYGMVHRQNQVWPGWIPQTSEWPGWRESEVQYASSEPLISDSISTALSGASANKQIAFVMLRSPFTGTHAHLRHLKVANVLFFDNHVASGDIAKMNKWGYTGTTTPAN